MAKYELGDRRLDILEFLDVAAAIGFDDDHIYREFGKPIDGRTVPFIHLQSEEARRIFQEWLEKPDKIPY